jgi:hypothetical protein
LDTFKVKYPYDLLNALPLVHLLSRLLQLEYQELHLLSDSERQREREREVECRANTTGEEDAVAEDSRTMWQEREEVNERGEEG